MTEYPSDRTELDPLGPAAGEHLSTATTVQGFRLLVIDGPDNGKVVNSRGDRGSIGSLPSNDLVLDDRTVSRFHCEINLSPTGPSVEDLESLNGTLVDGVRVKQAWLRDGSVLRLGQSSVSFSLSEETLPIKLWPQAQFGSMVGTSVPMRATFSELAKAAATDSTVLLEGETGTGKEEAALSIHSRSGYAKGPFVVVDCSAIPSHLLESELFGHERGAFTGATTRRDGAFLAASGGTVFLDEIGEFPQDLQPKILRVLEARKVRRVGGESYEDIDIRVIAATNRSLRTEVNAGRFRSDLYYRLAVVMITIPALRNRPDDIPSLSDYILKNLGASDETIGTIMTPELSARLQAAAWPGNVRQLRNYLERCLVFEEPPPFGSDMDDTAGPPNQLAFSIDPSLSYSESRRRVLDAFERRYIQALLDHHEGNVSKATRAAGMNRAYMYRLLSRHNVKR